MKTVFLSACFVASVLAAPLASAGEVSTFVASGVGRAVAQPDIVFLRIGFKSEGKTPQDALDADAESARRVTDVLLRQGLQPNDLETDGYAIEEIMGPAGCGQYRGDQPPAECELEGYRLNNSITMRIRNIENYGKILSGAIAAASRTSATSTSRSPTSRNTMTRPTPKHCWPRGRRRS